MRREFLETEFIEMGFGEAGFVTSIGAGDRRFRPVSCESTGNRARTTPSSVRRARPQETIQTIRQLTRQRRRREISIPTQARAACRRATQTLAVLPTFGECGGVIGSRRLRWWLRSFERVGLALVIVFLSPFITFYSCIQNI